MNTTAIAAATVATAATVIATVTAMSEPTWEFVAREVPLGG
ncbi:hypothetical protein [Streptomyces sp. BPTC-684]|nr:hypothetical protein [Streptomyces sp. BPTC-684]WHM35617.1 hypothetical protein QIY60_00970 [Streptomyces sp. BPTC-684]